MSDKTYALDFLGREIRVGSEVVYPGRQGSSLWLNYGIVQELKTKKSWRGDTMVLRVNRIPLNRYSWEFDSPA